MLKGSLLMLNKYDLDLGINKESFMDWSLARMGNIGFV